ncbi:alanine--tRNA ligase [Rickettsiales endosymbiont of Peranema trichophorum]|uniref:alanine--tRNA ligase n=1 Tax=Rickettsiales endosymbiont of Peranema trichophorum TaxID=2486577 RepID=UPI001022B358|nr:alanine--tRNA ligase [Rickettsiales endosymbiont of Peranema trichophorum]RZI47693.1 alanine--tRNA ligase [Rickettsiales endosymbiont of Peranema trichophorum]
MYLNEIRSSFLSYFKHHDHHVEHSSSLIPHNDPTLMFTGAGMVPFKNYFTGLEAPHHKKITTAQKCVRAGGKHNDLENVGYTARHHTFFEMLGNFSFGGYFKEEAIELAWQYLTKELSLPHDRLYITVYHDDMEAFNIWKKLTNFSDSKIIKIASSDNFWAMGDQGPCGPCSEIFYDHGSKYEGGLPGTPTSDGDRYVEIWNLVFMQYERLQDGSLVPLPKPCIDTGMGLERITAVLQGTYHNYETDVFQRLIGMSQKLSSTDQHTIISHRVIADHLRCAAFLIAAGILPSNEGRGYVLRRIMRRAMRHVQMLQVQTPFLHKLVSTLVQEMGEAYSELKATESAIVSTFMLEEETFQSTLKRGLALLNKATSELKFGDTISGDVAFSLYDTYGFPLDLTKDILKDRNIQVDEAGFELCMEQQRIKARASWAGSGESKSEALWYQLKERIGGTDFVGYTNKEIEAVVQAIVINNELVNEACDCEATLVLNQTVFYAESGGQVGDTGNINDSDVLDTKKFAESIIGHITTIKNTLKVGDVVHVKIDTGRRRKIQANHSATHILHNVLRKRLGTHVVQKGSMVGPDKLRFDFSHTERISQDELVAIEREINQVITTNHTTHTTFSSLQSAIAAGAMALFGEKYDNDVRMMTIGESIELCGGTHVHQTGEIGAFKIVSEESIASGVRRIEAVTGLAAIDYMSQKQHILQKTAIMLKCQEGQILERLAAIMDDKQKIEKSYRELQVLKALKFDIKSEEIQGLRFIVKIVENFAKQDLKCLINGLLQSLGEGQGIILLFNKCGDNVELMLSITKGATAIYQASAIVKHIIANIGGNGGGNAELAQAGGIQSDKLEDSVQLCKEYMLQLNKLGIK